MIQLKTKEEIEKLKEGGKILADILIQAKKITKIGTDTSEINNFVNDLMIKNNVKPSFLNYTPSGGMKPFPGSLCVCLNEEIVHGIPNEDPKTIKDGDVVTLDAGIIYEGLYTDHAITFIMGDNSNQEIKNLIHKTEEALYAGIKQAVIGNTIGDIGNAIEKVARESKLNVINELCGHGVGYKVHEDPYVPNRGEKHTGEKIEEGLVIAIEPMFSLGSSKIILEKDGYTFRTADKSISAQFEHTVAVTKNGPLILTKK